MDPVVATALRGALALLFATAAWHKLRDRRRFRATMAAYRLVPAPLVGAASATIVLAEGTLAAALLAPAAARLASGAAAALLILYAAAIAVNLRRGRRHLDCGCLGSAGRETISWWLVARNVALAAMAASGLAPIAVRPLVWVDAVTASGVFGLAVLAWLAGDGLLANRAALARLRAASAPEAA
jgi:hypothetical protein